MSAARRRVAGLAGRNPRHRRQSTATARSTWPRCWPASVGSRPGRSRWMAPRSARSTSAARRRLGLRYITDERLGEGTVPPFSVAINLVMKEIGAPVLWDRGVSRWDKIHGHARARIDEYDIRTPSERTPLGRLSGGNIQKVLLARELGAAARVVIFNKPTYGLDLAEHPHRPRSHPRRGGGGQGDHPDLDRARRTDRAQRPHRRHLPGPPGRHDRQRRGRRAAHRSADDGGRGGMSAGAKPPRRRRRPSRPPAPRRG